MLDNETKRKIDNCRDILVGKVPDPKSQVEQITIALIYKFMDDMDKQSEHWGGKPSFFIGEHERYAWSKIFDPRLGGFDLIALYGDAIVKMNQNPNIPQLFRDIFKNAYLPYRDPETLKSFLKQINEFSYDHSERLGDAYEYLLSILSSQGEAGQFRTPRHIIDFIVKIIDPKKNETVLDPACGTAGFLISSYRHILQSNKEKTNGDKLTTTEKKRLVNNFSGYDISPDMVRMSLVNMYLHKFPEPKIYEYDTLTSEERWNETADCILANPPFMTPKGGIVPHKRFSVQAKRSEVLFVDYIAEHLNPSGRAGVIVPEGILFQSSNAYKQLRKMLVDNFLWCVVSLPAGVFNPYAGGKTSIFFMDKQLAKKTDYILFVKIENDGFDLGAQRRPIDQNDLPKVLKYIKQYQKELSAGFVLEDTDFAHSVEKEKIAETGDYNLSGDRYKTFEHKLSDWPMVKLGEIAEYVNGYAFKPSDWKKEGKKIIRIQNLTKTGNKYNYTNRTNIPRKYLVERGDMLISWSATIGFYIWDDEDAYLNQHIFKVIPKKDKILKEYFYYLGNQISGLIKRQVHGHTMTHITKNRFEQLQIPLPPLDIQKKIVAEIEGYQKEINKNKEQIAQTEQDIKAKIAEVWGEKL